MREFRLTEDHLALLQNSHVRWDDCEFGAPGIDSKRPYGNSSVVQDIAEILEWELAEYETDEYEEQAREATDIHAELEYAMQIVLCFAGKAATPGLYKRKTQYGNEWERIGD